MLITHLKQRAKVGESLLLNTTHGFVDLLYLTMGVSAPAQTYSEAGFRVRVGWEQHASSSPVALCRWLALSPPCNSTAITLGHGPLRVRCSLLQLLASWTFMRLCK